MPQLYGILAAAGFQPRVRLEPLDDHDETAAAWAEAQPDNVEWERRQADWGRVEAMICGATTAAGLPWRSVR